MDLKNVFFGLKNDLYQEFQSASKINLQHIVFKKSKRMKV